MNLPPPSGPPAGPDYRSSASNPGSGSNLKRAGSRYRSWPLWAKIAAPGTAIFVGLGAVGTVTEPAESADTEVAVAVANVADLPEPTPSPTTFPPTTVPATAAPPTTATPTTPPTTIAPTTVAPTTVPPTPPTTAAPTPPPTTAAPTLPPTTAPPPPPPPAPAAAATDPDYGTCKEAKAHGAGPYYAGTDPEYDWYRDADSDGIVCE